MKSEYTVPTAIVIGGIIVAIAVFASLPKGQLSTGSGRANPSLVRPISASDHILGNPSAPIMIVVYSDFDCSFCKGFHDTMHQIVAIQGASGKVAWTFRQFPLNEIHPNAAKHARASECAAEVAGNAAFWSFADALYKNQPADPSSYGTLAATAGIKGDGFAACMSGDTTALDARIAQDRQNALDMGAEGTPFSILLAAGQPPVILDGAYSYDAVKELVTKALQNLPY